MPPIVIHPKAGIYYTSHRRIVDAMGKGARWRIMAMRFQDLSACIVGK